MWIARPYTSCQLVGRHASRVNGREYEPEKSHNSSIVKYTHRQTALRYSGKTVGSGSGRIEPWTAG